jgi:hypothetical protein
MTARRPTNDAQTAPGQYSNGRWNLQHETGRLLDRSISFKSPYFPVISRGVSHTSRNLLFLALLETSLLVLAKGIKRKTNKRKPV